MWEPRFLLFEKSSDLLRIGLAGARAEGFLEPPRLPAVIRRKPKTDSGADDLQLVR